MTSTTETQNMAVNFYIKEVNTSNFKTYKLSTQLTVREFIAQIQTNAASEILFVNTAREDIVRRIHVIEAGQELGEEAPQLEPSDMTMLERYGDKLPFTAFYVRLPSITIPSANIPITYVR